jgi:RNA polymerase sigma-70 factor (ECF subfamily)
MDERTDHELIYAAQAGDRRAFSALVERHYRFMFRVAWQWCGSRTDAEDIAQDAAIKLAQNIGAFRFEAAFTTWLYRLVVNAAKDHFKAKNRTDGREQPMFEDVQYASAELSPEERLECKDVLKALSKLPDEMRETVMLVCWRGMSHKEAGEALDCAEGTISYRVHEARKKIAELLEIEKKVKRHG